MATQGIPLPPRSCSCSASTERARKAAETARPKLESRLSKGEKADRRRMVTVAAVYFVEPNPRTASAILGERAPEPVAPRPKPTMKRLFASLRKQPREVIGAAVGRRMVATQIIRTGRVPPRWAPDRHRCDRDGHQRTSGSPRWRHHQVRPRACVRSHRRRG